MPLNSIKSYNLVTFYACHMSCTDNKVAPKSYNES